MVTASLSLGSEPKTDSGTSTGGHIAYHDGSKHRKHRDTKNQDVKWQSACHGCQHHRSTPSKTRSKSLNPLLRQWWLLKHCEACWNHPNPSKGGFIWSLEIKGPQAANNQKSCFRWFFNADLLDFCMQRNGGIYNSQFTILYTPPEINVTIENQPFEDQKWCMFH